VRWPVPSVWHGVSSAPGRSLGPRRHNSTPVRGPVVVCSVLWLFISGGGGATLSSSKGRAARAQALRHTGFYLAAGCLDGCVCSVAGVCGSAQVNA
jgi:hypothetical protein